MPICGIKGVWREVGEAFFRQGRVVSELTQVNATTLYSLWHAEEDQWLSAQELEEAGVDEIVAERVATHLAESLLPAVYAAKQVPWQVQIGDWCTDLWPGGDEADFYNSV